MKQRAILFSVLIMFNQINGMEIGIPLTEEVNSETKSNETSPLIDEQATKIFKFFIKYGTKLDIFKKYLSSKECVWENKKVDSKTKKEQRYINLNSSVCIFKKPNNKSSEDSYSTSCNKIPSSSQISVTKLTLPLALSLIENDWLAIARLYATIIPLKDIAQSSSNNDKDEDYKITIKCSHCDPSEWPCKDKIKPSESENIIFLATDRVRQHLEEKHKKNSWKSYYYYPATKAGKLPNRKEEVTKEEVTVAIYPPKKLKVYYGNKNKISFEKKNKKDTYNNTAIITTSSAIAWFKKFQKIIQSITPHTLTLNDQAKEQKDPIINPCKRKSDNNPNNPQNIGKRTKSDQNLPWTPWGDQKEEGEKKEETSHTDPLSILVQIAEENIVKQKTFSIQSLLN